jgi:hypothetical protein
MYSDLRKNDEMEEGFMRKHMSLTSYGNWRDFSTGKKSLADFAGEEKPIIEKININRGNSLNSSLKPNANLAND